MSKRLRILVVGDMVAPTGFSRVIHSIFGEIKDFIDFKGIGINYRGDPHNYGLEIYPAQLGGDLYGINRLREFVTWKPDLIFILNDVWVIDKYLEAIKGIYKDSLPKIIVYFPVDAEEHDSSWYKHFDIVDVPVTYTEFGKSVVLKAAPHLSDSLRIIPHGVSDKLFYKIDKSRDEIRRELFGSDKLDGTFIFLNANRNQPRKRLDITLEAFSFIQKDFDNLRLYMHCGIVDSSINIDTIARRFGIDNKLIVSSVKRGIQNFPEQVLNMIYNSSDVGLNTGLGEGWGLTNIEHTMTGGVQIVPNHSALGELYHDCGVLVPAYYKYTMDNIMTVGKLVRPEDMAEAMLKLYLNKDEYTRLQKAGLTKFSDPKYSWKEISTTWYKLFLEV